MNKFFILLSISVVLLVGCFPNPLDVEVEVPPTKLVVSSQVVPNSVMAVWLSRSYSPLEFQQDTSDTIPTWLLNELIVDRGFVTVSYRDVVDTLYHVDSGLFISLTTPQYINEEYTLYVYDSVQQLEATAKEPMLPFVGFDEIYPIIEVNGNDTVIKVHHEFTDLPGNNWYMLNYFAKIPEGKGVDVYENFERGENLLLSTQLISDKEFNSIYKNDFIIEGVTTNDSISVTLSNISEVYFQYLQLRKKSSNWFAELTGEPINYPSNIVNGYGFFTTHYPDAKFFDLKEWE